MAPRGSTALFHAMFESDDFAEATYNAGVFLWEVDEWGSAMERFASATDLDSVDARLALGLAQLWCKRPTASISTLQPLVLRPDEIGARASGAVGRAKVQLGQGGEELVQLFSHARKFDRDYADELAKALVEVGRVTDAVVMLREEVQNKNPVAPLALGNICADVIGDIESAEAAYRAGIQLGDAFSAYNLAALLAAQGRNREATVQLRWAARHGDERASNRLRADRRRR